MALITITAADVAWVIGDTHDGTVTFTAPAEEALAAGQFAKMTVATGFMSLGNATTTTENGSLNPRRGIAINSVAIGGTTTFVKKGLLNVGAALAGLAYGAIVYLSDTDGTLGDAAGTVSTIAGHVVPGYANTTPDKLLQVDL